MEDAERELIVRAYEVATASQEACTPVFLSMLAGVKDNAKTYTFKHRFKSSSGIERKVRRKRRDGQRQQQALKKVPAKERNAAWRAQMKQARQDSSYSPDNVTDVLGCRYVALYQSEIPRIVEELLKAIETYNKRDDVELIDVHEFVIYTNRPAQDPISIVNETRAIVERSDLFKDVEFSIRPPETRKSAYSSVHFVFYHDANIRHPGKPGDKDRSFFEVQVRDIFEEGWGEVQHDLLYSNKDEDEAVFDKNVEHIQWELHLNALKTFVDGCSQHASIIKANLDGLHATKAPTTSHQSVSERKSDLEHIKQTMRRHRIDNELIDRTQFAYTLLISSEEVTDRKGARKRFADASKTLAAIIAGLTSRQLDYKVARSGDLTIRYFLQMELAASYVTTADLSDTNREKERLRGIAETIYGEVLTRFPDDPTANMRMGKVLQCKDKALDELKRAETLFDQAIRLIGNDPALGPDHWMAISTRTDKGYAIWEQGKLAAAGGDSAKFAEFLLRAISATQDAFEIWKLQSPSGSELNKVLGHKAASNVIYYLSALAESGAALTGDQRSQLETMVAAVETFGVEPYQDWFKARDNLIHAYHVLGRRDRERELAIENFTELRATAERVAGHPLDVKEIRNHLTGSALVCFETANNSLLRTTPR